VRTAAPRGVLAEDAVAFRTLFRRDGRRLAVAYKSWPTRRGAGFRLWDDRGKPVGPFVSVPQPRHGHERLSLAFAGGSWAVLTFDSESGRLHARDAETGAARAARDLEAAGSVAFSDDGSLLATSNAEGTIRLWNTARGGRLEPVLT